MDINTLLHNLREEVSCSVCSNIFTEPKQLPCLHSFCLLCLRQWHRTSYGRETIRCPNCQAQSRIPESGDLKDLPTSFYLNGLIDVLAIKECRSSQVKCGNCDKKSSETSYCFQCCMFWCEKCVTGHNMMRENRDHRVLALTEFREKDYEDVLKRPVFCAKQRHEKKELEFFCKDCETAVCQTCVTLGHSGHALEHIEEEAERQKTEMKSMIETQRRNLQAKMNAVSQLDEDYAKLVQQGEDVKRDVQRMFDNLMAILEANKQNIFAAVETETQKSLERVTTEKTEQERQIDVIKSSLEKADRVLTRSTNAEAVQLKKSLEEILKGVDDQTELTDRDPRRLTALVFVENQKLLNTVNTEELGTLKNPLLLTKASQCVAEGKGLKEGTVGSVAQFVLKTRNAEGGQCYNKHDRVTVEIRDEQGRECATEVLINDNKDGSYNVSYSVKDQGRYKVTVKVNEEHICNSPFFVEIGKSRRASKKRGGTETRNPRFLLARPTPLGIGRLSESLEQARPFQVRPVLSFGQKGSSVGMFLNPWGVAVNERGEIAVADHWIHRVQIFNSEGNYLRSFGRKGNRNGEFNNPRGVTFHKNGNIFVADSWNNRIQIFTGEGEFVGSFGGKGNLDSNLSWPLGLSVDSDGNIIVADAGNKVIKIFSPNGEFLMKFGGKGYFSDPVHCIQCDRYLVVPDGGVHCIKVYDRNGNFQYKFGKQGGGDGEFSYPRCLSVNNSGHLFVCDKGNHRIQVFELNGKFVGKFGTEGRNLGEFKMPRSVAFQSNGRIVVGEFANHRIQIFKLQ